MYSTLISGNQNTGLRDIIIWYNPHVNKALSLGRVSSTRHEDLFRAIVYAQTMLDDCKTRKLQDKLGSAFGYWIEAQDKEK